MVSRFTFLYFELLIDVLAQKLTEWRRFSILVNFQFHDVINNVIITKDYTSMSLYKLHFMVKFGVHILNRFKVIGILVFYETPGKMQWIKRSHFDDLLWRHQWHHSNSNHCILHILRRRIQIWNQIEPILKIDENRKSKFSCPKFDLGRVF